MLDGSVSHLGTQITLADLCAFSINDYALSSANFVRKHTNAAILNLIENIYLALNVIKSTFSYVLFYFHFA